MKIAGLAGSNPIPYDRIAPVMNKILGRDSEIYFGATATDSRRLYLHVQSEGVIAANLDGHSVIVDSIDSETRTVTILDPWGNGPGSGVAFETILSMDDFESLFKKGRYHVLLSFDDRTE